MTEEKGKENPYVKMLQEQVKEIESLRTEISNLKTSLSEKSKAPPQPDTHESHWKAEDIINTNDTCPACKVEREKLKEAFGKPYMDEHWRDKLPHVCINCGEGVLIEEEKCPKCQGTKAKKRN